MDKSPVYLGVRTNLATVLTKGYFVEMCRFQFTRENADTSKNGSSQFIRGPVMKAEAL